MRARNEVPRLVARLYYLKRALSSTISYLRRSLCFSDILTMPLFRDHPIRSTIAAAGALTIGHFLTKLMSSSHAFHLTQTSVAILAIASMMFMVTMHHRREGGLLTQTQEEMVLICGFGLFWIAVLLAWRATSHRAVDPVTGGELSLASAGTGKQGFTGIRPYPCSSDDIHCVVEDWTFY